MITDRELKEYALIGLLVRINAEKEKLTKQTEPKAKVMIETRIDRMTQIYESLLYELRQAAEQRYNIRVQLYHTIGKYHL